MECDEDLTIENACAETRCRDTLGQCCCALNESELGQRREQYELLCKLVAQVKGQRRQLRGDELYRHPLVLIAGPEQSEQLLFLMVNTRQQQAPRRVDWMLCNLEGAERLAASAALSPCRVGTVDMLPCGGQWKPTLLQQGGLARALCERGFKHQWEFLFLEYYAERSSSNRHLRMVIHGDPDFVSCTALNNDIGNTRKLPAKGPVDHLLAGPVAARKGALGR